MDNRFFTKEMLSVLLRPEAWRVVCSAFPPEAPVVTDARHQEWMAGHTHAHAHEETLIVLRGESRLGIQGRIYPAAPGTVFVLGAHEAHDFLYPDWSPDLDHLWIIGFHGDLAAQVITIRNGTRQPPPWNHLITREDAGLVPGRPLTPRQRATGSSEALARMKVGAALSLLVGALVDAGYEQPTREERETFQERIVRTIQRHIEDTGGNGASLAELAHIAGYSPFHFLRLFRRHTGFTVHDYVDHCRLRRVEELRARGHSQKEIAGALGFSCPSAFSRWYRQRTKPASGGS